MSGMPKDYPELCGCGEDARYLIGGASACNKHVRCPSYKDIMKRVRDLEDALMHYREAMELTRQYVGYKTLPAIEGWSWYDADEEARILLKLGK